MWSDFSSELRYKYIRFLLKDLNNAEMYYLRVLRSGVDEQITQSVNWVKDNRDELKGLHDYSDWLEYYRDDSELEMILLTLLGNNVDNSIKPLYNFYRSGGDLASAHMNKSPSFQDSDRVSLRRLSNFIGTVVSSINSELTLGLVNLIGKSIDEGSLDDIGENAFDIRNESGKNKYDLKGDLSSQKEDLNRFSTDTRCLFTVKTEYARAVNTGLLQGYSNYGVDEYDWITSGLSNVCKQCRIYEQNSPYTLNEIINMMPTHINCICSVKGRLGSKYLELVDNPVIVDLTPKE